MWSVRAAQLARLCFIVPLVLAILVLVTWLSGRWQLGTVGRGDVPMAPTTAALMLVLATTGLRVQSRGWTRSSAVVGVIVIAVGTLALWWRLSALESALVRVFAGGPLTRDAGPVGVMSPLTAAAFILSGLAVLGQHVTDARLRQAGTVSATLAASLAASVASGYLLPASVIFNAAVPMAFVTSVAFVLSSLGLVLSGDRSDWPLSLLADVEGQGAHSRRRLRTGVVALGVLVTSTVLGAATLYLVSSRLDARRAAANDLEAAAESKSRDVARWYRERWGDALAIANSSLGSDEMVEFLGAAPGTQTPERLSRWLAMLRDSYSYSAVILYDEHAVARLSEGRPGRIVARPALERSARLKQVVLDDFDLRDGSGRRQISFIAPVLSAEAVEQPPVIGLIALVVDARDDLYPMLASWPFRNSAAETVLIEQDGPDVVFLNDVRLAGAATRAMHRAAMSTPRLVAAQALAGTPRVFEGLDYAGERVLASARPVDGTPWHLVAKKSTTEVYAPFWRDVRRTGTFSLLLIVITTLGLAVISRHQRLRALEGALAVERERHNSTERLRAAMGASLDPFAVLDDQGRIVEWNAQAETTFGRTRADAFGLPFTAIALVPPHDAEYAGALAAFARGEDHPLLRTRVSVRARRRDGEEFPAEVTVMPVRLRPHVTFSVVVRDITERVAADAGIRAAQTESERLLDEAERSRRALLTIVDDQRRTEAALRDSENLLESRVLERTVQLESANRELEAFSYSVSHDLRTPLRAIGGYARMVVEDYGGALDPEGLRRLGIIQREAGRMAVLIDDLLRFSRLARQPLDRELVDMTALAHGAFAELTGDLARSIHFVVADLPPALADGGVMRQVWMNLIGNALKFTSTRDCATIEVGGSATDHEGTYFVRDNGVGFDMRYADKLFGVFQRLHSTGSFEGTGVGLAFTQRIISRHGGRIWAEAAVDAGATFYFTVPVGPEQTA
ncbi:MAG TPA: ATP-binding protein [Vicinamibacterales bacterium]|nr:ATP-binding protein [Vicinamibacterales bacterium]